MVDRPPPPALLPPPPSSAPQAGKLDVNAATLSGQYTPLMLAALCGRAHAVEQLLKCGAVISARSRRGATAVHFAAQVATGGDALRALLAHPTCTPALVRRTGFRQRSPLMLALLTHGSTGTVCQLLAGGADADETVASMGSISALHTCAHLSRCAALGAGGSCVCLCVCVAQPPHPLHGSHPTDARLRCPLPLPPAHPRSVEALQALLEAGANANAAASDGIRVVHEVGGASAQGRGFGASQSARPTSPRALLPSHPLLSLPTTPRLLQVFLRPTQRRASEAAKRTMFRLLSDRGADLNAVVPGKDVTGGLAGWGWGQGRKGCGGWAAGHMHTTARPSHDPRPSAPRLSPPSSSAQSCTSCWRRRARRRLPTCCSTAPSTSRCTSTRSSSCPATAARAAPPCTWPPLAAGAAWLKRWWPQVRWRAARHSALEARRELPLCCLVLRCPTASACSCSPPSLAPVGADLEQRDRDGMMPLHAAVLACQAEAVDCLLRQGADPLSTCPGERG